MKSKAILINLVLTSIVLFIAASLYLFKKEITTRHLPIYGEIRDFTLTDTDGKDFGSKELKGKIWVADFIFTTCGSICPVMTKNMAQLHRSYVLEPGVEMVSISVNPENDSPAVLLEYAKKQKADVSKWHFLTGSRAAIDELAIKGFKMGTIGEPMFHSGKFVLVDRAGQIRGFYEGTDSGEIRKLFQDTAVLMKEKH